jgi:hypothetical protein
MPDTLTRADDLYSDLFYWLTGRPASPALCAALPGARIRYARQGAYRSDAAAPLLALLPADDHLHRVAAVARRNG